MTRLNRTLALVLAGGSLAIGVPAAIAAGGGDGDGTAGSTAPTPGFVQDEQQPNQPRGEDCPEKDGQGGSGAQSDSSSTEAPSI